MNAINSIDLQHVINRMIKVHGWIPEAALEVSTQYRNFLFLKKKYGELYSLPPSVEIDEFWHNHILHTKAYHQDCLFIFGKYLHHTPQLETEKMKLEELEDKFNNETQRFYFAEFGDYIYEIKIKSYKGGISEKIIKSLFKKKKKGKSSVM